MTVTVYSTPTCPFCNQAKEFLTENKIQFTDYDVTTNQEKAQESIHKSGQMGVPVIDIDGTIVIGFDEAKLKEVLGL